MYDMLAEYGLSSNVRYFNNRLREYGFVDKAMNDTIEYVFNDTFGKLLWTEDGWLCECGNRPTFPRSVGVRRKSCGLCVAPRRHKKQSIVHLCPQHKKAWKNYMATRPNNVMTPDEFVASIGQPPTPNARYFRGRWINLK